MLNNSSNSLPIIQISCGKMRGSCYLIRTERVTKEVSQQSELVILQGQHLFVLTQTIEQVVGSMFGTIWSHIILSSAAIVKQHPTPLG